MQYAKQEDGRTIASSSLALFLCWTSTSERTKTLWMILLYTIHSLKQIILQLIPVSTVRLSCQPHLTIGVCALLQHPHQARLLAPTIVDQL